MEKSNELEYVLELRGLPKLNTAMQLDVILPSNSNGPISIKIRIPVSNLTNITEEVNKRQKQQELVTQEIASLTSPMNSLSPRRQSEMDLIKPISPIIIDYDIRNLNSTRPKETIIINDNPIESDNPIKADTGRSPGYKLYRKSVIDRLNSIGGADEFEQDEVNEEIDDYWNNLNVEERKDWDERGMKN